MYKFHCAVHSPAGIHGKAKFYISDAFYSTTQTITNSHKVEQDLCDRYVYQERSWRFEVQTKEIYYSQQGDFEFLKKFFRPVSVNKVTIFRKKRQIEHKTGR